MYTYVSVYADIINFELNYFYFQQAKTFFQLITTPTYSMQTQIHTQIIISLVHDNFNSLLQTVLHL